MSGYLHSEVQIGDELEVRGPIGGWFVWEGYRPRGAVRRRLWGGAAHGDAAARSTGPLGPSLVRLLVSVRTPDDLYYRGEIAGPETTVVYTREAPPTDARGGRPARLADVMPFAGSDATFYVCGSTGFAEAATQLLVDAGINAEAIRVERFGPTG